MATNKSSTAALKKVEDQITCPICMEHFTDPRVLPCFHSYCLKCIQCVPIDFVVVEDCHYLPCPTCRSPCPVPDKGLASLPPSFVVNNLVEVYDLMKKASAHQHVSCDNCDNTKADRYCKQCTTFLCPECLHHHNGWKPNAGHQILTLDEVTSTAYQLQHAKQEQSIMTCTEHNEPLKMYCESCQQLICHDCTVSKHEKPLHKYYLVNDIYSQRKGEIDQVCLQPLNEKYNRLVTAKRILASKKDQIPKNARATKVEILQTIAQIKHHLDEMGKNLTQEVDSVAQYKVNILEEQIKEVDTAIGQVGECRDRVDECVKVASPQQVLLTAQKIIKHTKSVIASVKDKTFKPLEQPNIQLVKCDTIPQIRDIIGKIKTSILASSIQVSLISHCQSPHQAYQESTVTIALSLPNGSSVPVPLSLINCRLTPLDNSPPIQCSVKESLQSGQYDVVFIPTTIADYQLRITMNSKNILGSPVYVPVSHSQDVFVEYLCPPSK